MPAQTDDRWVADHLERWRAGREPEALGELLKWQRDRAFAIACRVLGNHAEAEDAVQQAFLKLFRSAPVFEGPSAFHAAVYRSVTQCAIDLARTKHARRVMEHAMAHQGRSNVPASPGDALEQREAVLILQQEMQTLGPEDRALLALCCQEGLSLVAAAETLNLPRETARDRLSRLLNDLRRRLAKRGVALSLVLLVGLLQQGRSAAASEALCVALNTTLPGAACASLVPAAATAVPASAVLVQAGLSAGGFLAAKVLIVSGVAAVVCASAVTYAVLQTPTPVPEQKQTRPVEKQTPPPIVVAKVVETAPKPPVVAPAPPPEGPPVKAPEKQVEPPPQEPNVDAGVEKKAGKIPLEDVPQNIRAALEAAAPGIRLVFIEREVEDNQIVYEFEGHVGERFIEIKISKDGRVVKFKEKEEADEEDREKGGGGKKGVPPPAPPKIESEF